MAHETVPPADANDVMVEQLAYLIAISRRGTSSPSENLRLLGILAILQEPFRDPTPARAKAAA